MTRNSLVPVPCKIKAIGAGGGGCNAINRMVKAEIQGVEFIAVNTDAQALMGNQAFTRIQIGEQTTRGLGAGGDPTQGRKAAEESRDELNKVVKGADMIFVAGGMGGGTGTGSCPVIAELAKESGALTIAIVTKPFAFEGAHRRQTADEGINQLVDKVDAMIVIPNDRLLSLTKNTVAVDSAFKMADDVLMTGVRTISEVITVPGLINLDFADVRSVMKNAGPAWLSIGDGSGHDRCTEAARSAVASPLLESSIEGARGIIYVIRGSHNLTLSEVNEAAGIISRAVDPEANIIFGVTFDSRMNNDVRITLIATGFTSSKTVAETQRDEEFHRLIKNLDESELETPAFLRRPLSLRRQVHKSY